MNEQFLQNLLQMAKQVTEAERGMAVNQNLDVLNAINLEQSMMQSNEFSEFANICLRQAIDTGEAVITNNIITDPSQAPTTNTNFADLRVIIALPVIESGAVYLDKPIRDGVIPKKTTEKLMKLISHVLENGYENSNNAELVEIFEQLD